MTESSPPSPAAPSPATSNPPAPGPVPPNPAAPGPTTPSNSARREEVLAVLQEGRKSGARWRWGLAVAFAAALALGWWLWQRGSAEPPAIRYETATVQLGQLKETVTATGTLNPVDAVELGAEVTGRLIKVTVDVNDEVEEGQLLAEIDPDQLQARVQEARASLNSALANRESAEASLAEAKLTAERLQALHDRGLASSQELETAKASAARAKSSLAAANAQITVARAGLSSAQTSLSKALIIAPISGVVLARNVEPGQTLTAGFQTPVLFTLGRDLTQLELKVEVDEADIGKVQEGQTATFVVDAYPNRTFDARLVKLHNLPTTVEGVASSVVTYSAVLEVDNPDRLLRPGMTATATINTRTLDEVMLVPNVALRFEPPVPSSPRGGFWPFTRGRRSTAPRPTGTAAAPPAHAERVWVLSDTQPKAVAVEAIGTDGIQSAITPLGADDPVKPGTEVLVDIIEEPPS